LVDDNFDNCNDFDIDNESMTSNGKNSSLDGTNLGGVSTLPLEGDFSIKLSLPKSIS